MVRATILAATALWAATEILKLRRPGQIEPARQLWTFAIALAIVHALAAFHGVYGWSHVAAVDATAKQTAALTGLAWGGGLFVNYAFLAAWAADAIWWWIAPTSYRLRAATVEHLRLAFFVFMFVNGAIVFAGGAARFVGIAAVGAVCSTWALLLFDRRGARGAGKRPRESSTTIHV